MFGRDRKFARGEEPAQQQGGVATQQRSGPPMQGSGYQNGGTAQMDAPPPAPARERGGGGRAAEDAVVLDRDARLRQRDRFGGFNWGAGFFGWLVALGLGTILTAIVAAAGAAIGLTNNASTGTASKNAATISIVGGAVLLLVGVIAYYAGGYVAGRMSRFDGGRQGFGAWLVGLIITLVIGAAGAIFGSQYNVLSGLHLPRIPIDEGSLTTGGGIFLAAFLVLTLLASILGGTVGRRYHSRVDRAAID
jgi:hypothetical protein